MSVILEKKSRTKAARANVSNAGIAIYENEHLIPKPICLEAGKFGLNDRQKRYFAFKYGLDRAIGIVLLCLFAPLIALLWIAVRATSAGPGFYFQTRVGLNGRLFRLIKLRSMYVNAEAAGIRWCSRGDRRVTWLGWLLRKLHLDELPQLWNVAVGDMCLVGPRPERPEITAALERLIPEYAARNYVKPGVTGLSQVNLEPDHHINITRQKQILDLRYIDRAGLFLDLRMLGATALRMFCIKGTWAMNAMGLGQKISERELVAIGYQFNTPESELWTPAKGVPTTDIRVHGFAKVQVRSEPKQTEARPTCMADVPNAFTVDVEDYFQVTAFDKQVSRSSWDLRESRVEASTDRLLGLLDQHGVKGTFFVLGWVAEQYPELIARIHAAGHELGSHGFAHHLIYQQTPEQFAMDLIDSRTAIAEACGVEVTAYRAPSFSITKRSLWALDILAEKGFTVDSSIFPIGGHDRYGIPGAKREIHELNTEYGTITEFPPSAWHISKFNLPVGGGYFRIFPYAVTRQAITAIRKQGRPAMFYTHPWEIDAEQPRIAGASFKSNFRHYTGLGGSYVRLDQLLRDFEFATLSDVIRKFEKFKALEAPANASKFV